MDQNERIRQAQLSLEGLSVGDAFGERFFLYPFGESAFVNEFVVKNAVDLRLLGKPPWSYTDDAEMALSIFTILRRFGKIDQEELVQEFALHYDPRRGYGPAMHRLLPKIGGGYPWRESAGNLFDGQGSYGNGAAMRVAPIGGYFADDLEAVIENARLSAQVTHAHPEASAGAIAVAVAAAWAARLRGGICPDRKAFLDLILPSMPNSIVREKIQQARDLDAKTSVAQAVAALGNGTEVSAQDTVPFVLWCAGEHLTNYEEALWLTVSGLGDRDTTCAMVGGIIALSVGEAGIPKVWRAAREPLPRWAFDDDD